MAFRASKLVPECVVLKMLLIERIRFFLFIVIRYVAVDLFICQELNIGTFKVGGIKAPGNLFRELPKIFFRLENLGL